MALADLLRALEQDAEARIATVRSESRAEADRLLAEIAQRLERRRTAELAVEEAELRAESARLVERARRDAAGRVLAARGEALERIRDRARELLGATEPVPDLRAGFAREIGTALEYVGDAAVVIQCGAVWRSALQSLVSGRNGVRLETTNGLGPGARIKAADGSLEIDATIETRLQRLWPELAIGLVRTMEPAS